MTGPYMETWRYLSRVITGRSVCDRPGSVDRTDQRPPLRPGRCSTDDAAGAGTNSQ